MRFPVSRLGATALFVLVATLAFVMAATAQEVDFSKAPAAGLKYKVVTKSTSGGTQSMTAGERSMEFTVKSERASTFTDAILEVKEGKTTKMEREYEDITNKQVMEAEGREPRDRERESPLAWKHFRLEWGDGDEVTVKVKEEDEWADPEDRLKKLLRPKRVRRAAFPLPAEAKSVGDTWELSDEQKKEYFPKRAMRGRDGEEGPTVEQEVTANLEFAEITEYREMKCAVIKAKIEIKTEIGEFGSSTAKLEQTAYYSLEHHIVVGVKGTNETEGKMSQDRGEVTVEMATSGKGTSEITVTIEQPGKKEEAGG